MLLAIDVGNTHTVLGLYEGATLQASWRAATERGRTADEWGALLYTYLATRGLGLATVQACILASVVPPVSMALREMSLRLLGKAALVIEPGLKTGVRLAIDNPREVGADRVVNTAAAFKRYGGPCIVVDFGTATTFDAVGADGAYLGGAIAPGLNTAAEALYRSAARLHAVELIAPRSVIGKNTVSSMQAGIVLGYVALVEGLIARLKAELQPGSAGPIPVIATGGLSSLIASETSTITHTAPDLTLDGLRIIYELNAP
ncbi:MAG TPA: type III pantothenate kinase [Chloroflexia bacterium]|nr:type III pantothenate kinase [Chloroflexia bacterium]